MSGMSVEQALETALEHHRAGRLADAEGIYRQILAASPNHPDALHLLGVVANQSHRPDVGFEFIGKAIEIQPGHAIYHMDLGISLKDLGRLDEAAWVFQKSLALNPNVPDTHRLWGQTEFLANRLENARDIFQAGMKRFPDDPTFPYNAGVVQSFLGDLEQAAASLLRALDLKKEGFVEAAINLGAVLHRMGDCDGALERLNQAIAMAPDRPDSWIARGEILREVGRLDEAMDDFKKAIALRPEHVAAHDNLILLMHHLPRVPRRAIDEQLKSWNEKFAAPHRPLRVPHHRDRDPYRKLRVGFVSADFREHPVGRFMLPLLKKLDRKQTEVFCYSDARVKDEINRHSRLVVAANWRETSSLTHAQFAQQVREDGVDILIDLGNHMSGNRLPAFAEKPAPIQASWLAHCVSTGLETMDYLLADPHLVPPDQSPLGPEIIYRLPKTCWCYPEPANGPDPSEPPSTKTGHVTFGCLNHFCKVNDEVLEAWGKILSRLPDSRILLFVPSEHSRRRVLSDLRKRGVDENRVDFLGKMPITEYFNAYGKVDVALDPFPFNGGTTTCDALWMGVPVVSLAGEGALSRAGLSILANAGFENWAAADLEGYVRIAVDLAEDESARFVLRKSMREIMRSSSLMDIDRFASDMVGGFRVFWKTWVSSGG